MVIVTNHVLMERSKSPKSVWIVPRCARLALEVLTFVFLVLDRVRCSMTLIATLYVQMGRSYRMDNAKGARDYVPRVRAVLHPVHLVKSLFHCCILN